MLPNCKRLASTHPRRNGGFTLIELMIVVAIIAIILTLALPVYSNYTIRAKVGEALSVAAAAKTATAATCVEDRTVASLNNVSAGYLFEPTPYINNIVISGPCSAPVITLITHNTGASTDPTLTLTGSLPDGAGHITWSCTTSTSYIYVPTTCRS